MSNTIRILLTLDGKQYTADLQTAETKTAQFGTKVEDTGKKLGATGAQASALSAGLRGLVPAITTAAIINLGSRISETGQAFERTEATLTAVTGSQRQAREEMAFVRRESERLGTAIITTAGGYAQLTAASKGTNLEGAATRNIFSAVMEASARLGSSTENTNGVITALTQIMSKGTVQAEELRGQLGDRLPGAVRILATAMGVSTAELNRMLESGQLASDDVLPKLADGLRQTFGTDVNTRIETTTANITRLKNELQLTAEVASRPLNFAVGGLAEGGAVGLRYARENPGRALAGYMTGPLGWAGLAYSAMSGEQGREAASFAQRGTVSPTGASSFGVEELTGFRYPRPGDAFSATPAAPLAYPSDLAGTDEDLLDKLREEVALLGKITNEQKAVYQITEGRYKNEAKQIKDLILAKAKVLDQMDAEEEKQRAADARAREISMATGKAATEAQRQAESEGRRLRTLQTSAALMEHELATGTQLTGAARDLFELQQQMQPLAETSLENALAKLAALEAQVRAQRGAQAESTRELMRTEQPEHIGYVMGRIATAGGGGDIAQQTQIELSGEEARYAAELDLLDERNRAKLVSEEEYHRQAEQAEREHVERLKAIRNAEEQSRRLVMARQIDGVAETFGQLGDLAAMYGEEGFEAYKALKVAEALISAPSSAMKAYESALAIPIIGNVLAPVWAATAFAMQMTQAAAIRSATFQGRELGGPTFAGGMYQVGERGKPELYESGGNYYLIPGDRGGMVSPARSAPAGAVNVRIYNQAGASVSARRRSDGEIEVLIRESEERAVQRSYGRVQSDFVNGEGVARTASRAYGLKRREQV